jgi:hypothetical protein
MNVSTQSLATASNSMPADRRAFMRLSVEQRRRLLELQATGPAIYTPDSEVMEWIEQEENSPLD